MTITTPTNQTKNSISTPLNQSKGQGETWASAVASWGDSLVAWSPAPTPTNQTKNSITTPTNQTEH